MKYTKMENDYYKNNNGKNLKGMLSSNEEILWLGKPKKSAYLLGRIIPMTPIALIWILFDGAFIYFLISSSSSLPWFLKLFLIFFFIMHLTPVWIWLSMILTANKRYQNAEYAITNKRILIKSGFIGIDYQTINYKDISNVDIRVGLVDKMLGVGDIYISTNKSDNKQAILDISDCYEVYTRLQKIVLDIQTDIEYPNALRPDNNPGYNTNYKENDEK